jgi:hypothetical protein
MEQRSHHHGSLLDVSGIVCVYKYKRVMEEEIDKDKSKEAHQGKSQASNASKKTEEFGACSRVICLCLWHHQNIESLPGE